MAASGNGPLALNDDGTAKDPAAFREALKSDPERVKALMRDPTLAASLLDGEFSVMQETLKEIRAAEVRHQDLDQLFAMNSLERMRARCPVPRDVGKLYETLNKVGLQYGPAFRLLTDVHSVAE